MMRSRKHGRSKSGCAATPARLFLAGVVLLVLAGCSAPEPEAKGPPPLMPVVVAPPQPPEPPPPAPPLPPPPPVPKFSGHVASYKTQAEAEAAWPSLVQRFPILKDEPKRYVEIDLGGGRGKVIRLLLGNFVEHHDAMTYCHRLRSAGVFCAPHDLPPADSEKSAA